MADVVLRDMLEDADMVLIGLGEEFDDLRCLENNDKYNAFRKSITASDMHWILPAADAMQRSKTDSKAATVLEKLINLLSDRNYFVVSSSTNPDIERLSWKEKRFVAPCGSCTKKQCPDACRNALGSITKENIESLKEYLSGEVKIQNTPDLGVCPICGKKLVLNNVYAPKYDENGYLENWTEYTKWLQTTVNRKLLILEFGVGMNFPTVIRFPFEKMAFYNNKSKFCRVHKRLYQMPEELGDKGISIAENAIDWLDTMC
jgi:hypothetical protein